MPDRKAVKTAARYLGLKGEIGPDMELLLHSAYGRMLEAATPRHALCRQEAQVKPNGQGGSLFCFGGLPPVESNALCRLFSGCREGCVLLATLGMGVDLLIRRLAVTDSALSLAVGACGSAFIDEYIDGVLRAEEAALAAKGLFFTPRFSPGYGDAPLSIQPALLALLGAGRLGVHLTEGLLMVPEKSVSAFVGITRQPEQSGRCAGTGCAIREENA